MSTPVYDEAFAKHELVNMGRLHLPTGRIVTCDPYFCGDAAPFERTVTPGDYETQLCIFNSPEWGRRVALARILLQPGKRAIAIKEALKKSGDSGAYFVDSGTGSFMDELAQHALSRVFADFYSANPDGNYYTDVLAAEFKKNADPNDPGDIGKWTLYDLPDSRLNVALFASGLGDGIFQSFWGLDEQAQPVYLVTDFRILP